MYLWFVWDEENEDHIAQHGVTKDEFEEVVCNPEWTGRSRSSGQPIARGWTSTGKYLLCVWEDLDDTRVYTITAYEID